MADPGIPSGRLGGKGFKLKGEIFTENAIKNK